MSNRIDFEEKEGYLRCHVTGVDSLRFSKEFWTSASEKCRSIGMTKILLVEDLEGSLSTMEMFEIGELASECMRGLRVAFVDLRQEDYKDNEFGETVCLNRGGLCRLFRDEQTAEQWLLS